MLLPPTSFLIQWLITWVILAVVFFVAAESIQRYLYEVAVEKIAWRVLLVTPILAAALVKWRMPFQEMFFNPKAMVAHALLWFLACWLALRFQWQHAAAAGLLAVVTIAPVASSTVESFVAKRAATVTPTKTATAPSNALTSEATRLHPGGATAAPPTAAIAPQ